MKATDRSAFPSRVWTSMSLALLAISLLATMACKRNKSPEKTIIQNSGSDTMVNLAQAWAEDYAKVASDVSVEVSGGGSGTGIAALINGTVDIANCSRKVEAKEVEAAKKNSGKEPYEFMVGFDAMAIYVHKSNPMEQITLDQLADIYGEGGNVTKWSQIGVKMPAGADEIMRISRQSNSGTYFYFRETVLGKGRDMKLGSRDMNGSKDVVELVSKTPGAIGYSGMGYAMSEVKKLKVAKKKGDPAYDASVENTLNHTYPIARPLYMYTLGTPSGAVKAYMDWVHSEAGQNIVATSGYVPLPKP
jgi:phosphate transport system substrate-binding protein